MITKAVLIILGLMVVYFVVTIIQFIYTECKPLDEMESDTINNLDF
jgi:hypothetical protein